MPDTFHTPPRAGDLPPDSGRSGGAGNPPPARVTAVVDFGTPPPIPLIPEEASRTEALNRAFFRAFMDAPGETDTAAAIRMYQDLKEDVLARTYRFGLVNNRVFRAEKCLVVPYLMCDTLVIYRIDEENAARGGAVTTHRIDPGALLTDRLIGKMARVVAEPIDLESAIYDIDPDRLEVGPLDRLRDIAALLEKVNRSTNRNAAVYYLRHLVARLARPGGMRAAEAKNLLPEVHQVTRELVTFLDSQLARRLRLLTRITVRNLPALLGRPNLLDRLWSDTIDLAEIHLAGSAVVNEIRRTTHHALGQRTLQLSRGFLAYLETGDWSALEELGFATPSPADLRAREAGTARHIVGRVVGDLERLLGATEILTRLTNWRDSFADALLRCDSGRSILEELATLLDKGVRGSNRWTFLQQVRRLKAVGESFATPGGAARDFVEGLRALETVPPGKPGFDAGRTAREAEEAVGAFVEAVRAHHQVPLFSRLDEVEEAYRSGRYLDTFHHIRAARRTLAGLAARGGFPAQRYHLQVLDGLLEEMGYLALRHLVSGARGDLDLETCFEIIQGSVQNLEFDGLQSRDLIDLSDMLDTGVRTPQELENVLAAIVGCYHKIRRRVTWPFEAMAGRVGLDRDELRTTVANIQRYLHDLNIMVGFCDVARRRIQETVERDEAWGGARRADVRGLLATAERQGEDAAQEGFPANGFPFRIRHISHRESVAPIGGEKRLEENLRDECGGKGSGLLYINHLNIPTRDGFILPTTIPRCRAHLERRPELEARILAHLRILEADIEARSGERRRFGDPSSPLLLAVRGGSVFSMPGILSTVVFVGMNDEIARGLARDGPWRAYDSYRRFLASYAWSAWGFDLEPFDLVEQAKTRYGVKFKEELPPDGMWEVAEASKAILRDHGLGEALDTILHDLHAQLFGAVYSIFDSWDSETAHRYREIKGLCHSWHTAVIVQEMAFGNRMNAPIEPGMDETQASLTGVIPRTTVADSGMWRLEGEFKFSAAGDDLVGGVTSSRSIRAIEELHPLMPVLELRLKYTMTKLRRFMGMDQEIEFTVDRGRLSVLQARAAVAAADQPADRFIDPGPPVARGLGIRGGGFRGFVAFDEQDLDLLAGQARAQDDVDGVVLLIENPTPDDIPLIISADAVMTARGGSTSHAAIAVNGVEDKPFFGVMSVVGLVVRPHRKEAIILDAEGATRARLGPGDVLSLHGTTGEVFLGSRRIERVSG